MDIEDLAAFINVDPQHLAQVASWDMMYPPFVSATGRPCEKPGCDCGGQNVEMALVFDSSLN